MLTPLLGCGSNVFVRGTLNPNVISGTVSFVELSTVLDGGIFISVTLVTFQQTGVSVAQTFCGDQTSQFPPHQFIEVSFTPGPPCATLVQVVRN
jgi:hypothetical protein